MGIIEKAEEFAKKEYLKNGPAHGWAHVEKVRKTAFKLASGLEGVDLELLHLAVIFHDVDYSDPKFHTENSTRIAESFLMRNSYPEDRIGKVKSIMFSHTTHLREKFGEAELVEGKILYDADKINASSERDYSKLLYFSKSRELLGKSRVQE
ncbi:MAG: HD domain-containing protein [Candidatus Micrarchaeota archaeon]|nr:HD domain-containing protein [Candidatus Micrarchaeota archaeon]